MHCIHKKSSHLNNDSDFSPSFLTHKRHILAVLHQAADNNPCVWNEEIAKLLGLFVIFSLLQLKSGCSRFQNPLKPVLVAVCSLLCFWPWAKACGTAGRVKSYHSLSVRAALGLQSFSLKSIYFSSFGLGGSFLYCRYNSDQRASFVCHAEDPHLSWWHHLVPVFVNISFPVLQESSGFDFCSHLISPSLPKLFFSACTPWTW